MYASKKMFILWCEERIGSLDGRIYLPHGCVFAAPNLILPYTNTQQFVIFLFCVNNSSCEAPGPKIIVMKFNQKMRVLRDRKKNYIPRETPN